ncbi:hypothetical protein [Haladaptatus sp. AB643]|uniref:hypothetical protein n=1 Tax=Haladaptatus sp. AB643 TaxID=2934174 RepID=UPI00209C1E46|nr:hypothetical protein [Haladaptatus sp. AB643]MCO8243443.1 hypothetical protein [Haladaptatus sp. AB643]
MFFDTEIRYSIRSIVESSDLFLGDVVDFLPGDDVLPQFEKFQSQVVEFAFLHDISGVTEGSQMSVNGTFREIEFLGQLA